VTLQKREKRLLAVLGILAGLLLARSLFNAAANRLPARPAGETAGRLTAPPAAGSRFGQRRRGVAELPTAIAVLDLGEMEVTPRDLTVGRDPFRFGPLPPPPPPPPPSAEELERRRREEEERLRRLEEERRLAAIPKPPPVNLVFLGSFGAEGRRIAVFADEKGENLYNARPGDVLEEKFIVDRIGFESVDIKFVDFPDEPAKRLPIGG